MKHTALYSAAWLAIGMLFLFAPGIDLAVSRLFYVPGEGFPLVGWTPIRLLEDLIPWITKLIVVVAALGGVWLALVSRPLWRLDRKALIFIVIATALGPGLIVNTLLKDNWGRARPHQTEEFGGARSFSPAPLPVAQCARNCSFVSGHAALGFSLVSFALLLPFGQRRRIALAAAIGFGALVGLARIAVGHHFLSDVVYAGLVVVATSWLLYQAIVARDLLASPAALRCYRAAARCAAAAREFLRRMGGDPAGRLALWTAAVTAIVIVAIAWVDRPLALYFYDEGRLWRPPAQVVQRFGFGTPYLVGFSLAFIALRWGGALPRLRPWADSMREAAAIPAFLLAAFVVSGLAVNLLKVIFGRTRPKLLFADGVYDFGWLGLSADYWSFPSGHTATAAALMTALWCLWPRHVLFYVAVAALVGGSRVVTGAHYLSDVVMGAFVAVLVTRALALGFARFRVTFPVRRKELPEPVLRTP